MEENENKSTYEEHDASFDPDPETTLSEDELQDSILADSGMNAFQLYVAKMNDKSWNLAQRIFGVVLGVGASMALFWDGVVGANKEKGGFSFSLIIAVVIAMLIPNIVEKQSLRKIPKTRTTMAITLLICIVAYLIYMGATTGFNFRG